MIKPDPTKKKKKRAFQKGDTVTCRGDGPDLFVIYDIGPRGGAFLLRAKTRTPHGWEKAEKLTLVKPRTKPRRFEVLIDLGPAGNTLFFAEEVVMPAGATEEECEKACRQRLEDMLDEHMKRGWRELGPKETCAENITLPPALPLPATGCRWHRLQRRRHAR